LTQQNFNENQPGKSCKKLLRDRNGGKSWLKAATNPAPKNPLLERDRPRMRMQPEIGGSKFYHQREGATAFCT
jgi:hypothetical protein